MVSARLRRATEADAEALGALHVTSWRETYNRILPGEMLARLSIDARAAMWRKVFTKHDKFNCSAVILAEEGGHAIGFGSCGQQRDSDLNSAGFTGEFSAIYLLHSYQGHGVGRSIMSAMSKELLNAGHKGAGLWVLRDNHPARAFYNKLGGIIVGEKTDERDDVSLIEDAYGWNDLSSLII